MSLVSPGFRGGMLRQERKATCQAHSRWPQQSWARVLDLLTFSHCQLGTSLQ